VGEIAEILAATEPGRTRPRRFPGEGGLLSQTLAATGQGALRAAFPQEAIPAPSTEPLPLPEASQLGTTLPERAVGTGFELMHGFESRVVEPVVEGITRLAGASEAARSWTEEFETRRKKRIQGLPDLPTVTKVLNETGGVGGILLSGPLIYPVVGLAGFGAGYDDAAQYTLDENVRWQAGLANGGWDAATAWALGVLKPLSGSAKAGMANVLKNAANIGSEGVKWGIFGTLLKTGQNTIARALYDNNRGFFDNVLASGAGGIIVGLVFGVLRALAHLPPGAIGKPLKVHEAKSAQGEYAALAPEHQPRAGETRPDFARRVRQEYGGEYPDWFRRYFITAEPPAEGAALYGGLPVPSLKQLKAAASELGLLLPQVKRFAQVLAKGAMSVEEAARQTGVPLQAAMVLAQRFGQPEQKTWKETLKEGEAGLAEVPITPTTGVEGPPVAPGATPAPDAGQVPTEGVGGVPAPAPAPARGEGPGLKTTVGPVSMIAYHGTTPKALAAIQKKGFAPKILNGQYFGEGVYLTLDMAEAKRYGDAVGTFNVQLKQPFVLDLDKYRGVEDWYHEIEDRIAVSLFDEYGDPVTVHTRDPETLGPQGRLAPEATEAASAITQFLQSLGYDGVLVKQAGKTAEIVVFDPASLGRLAAPAPAPAQGEGPTAKKLQKGESGILAELRERAKQPADLTLPLGGVVNPKAAAFIRKMVSAVPEFAIDPTFTVNAEGKLTFHDGFHYAIEPDLLGVGTPSPGTRIRVDLAAFGIKTEAAAKRVAAQAEGKYPKVRAATAPTPYKQAEYADEPALNEALFKWKQTTGELPDTWAMPFEQYVAERLTHPPLQKTAAWGRRGVEVMSAEEATKVYREEHRDAVVHAIQRGKVPPVENLTPYVNDKWAGSTIRKAMEARGAGPEVKSSIPEIAAAQEADLARARANVRRPASEGGYGQPPAKQLQRAAPPAAKKIEKAEAPPVAAGQLPPPPKPPAPPAAAPEPEPEPEERVAKGAELEAVVRKGQVQGRAEAFDALTKQAKAEVKGAVGAAKAEAKTEAEQAAIDAEREKTGAVWDVQLKERLRAEAQEEATATKLSQARMARRAAVAEGRANIASLSLRLKAKRQTEDEIRSALVKVIKRMPKEIRGKLIARVRTAITENKLADALQLAWKYLTENHQRALINASKAVAMKIHKATLEFDPKDPTDQALTSEAERVLAALKRDLMKLQPGETPEDAVARLLKIKEFLVEGWHMHRDKTVLYTLQGMADAEDAARSVLKDLETWNPPAGVEPKGPMPGTPHRSVANRALDLNSYPDTVIEGDLGPEDGVLETMLVKNVGVDVVHHHFADWYAVYDPMNDAAKVATGGILGSEKDIAWKSDPLTFEIGGQKVTAERRFWLTVYAVSRDEDAMGKWLARTESDQPEPSTAVWSIRRGKVAFSFNNAAEAYELADAFAAADPKGAAYVDACLAALNAPGRYEKTDATHVQLFGTHIEKVPGTRMPTQYNVAVEKQRAVPDFSTASPTNIVRHLGHHTARLPGGRGVSMVFADFDNTIIREAWEDAAFNNYGPTLRDGWILMQQMVPHGEKPITLQAFLGERVGREVPQMLDRHLRYVAGDVGLSFQTRLEEAEIDPFFRRALHNAMGAAVGGFKWTPMANQIPAVILPMADTKPMHAEDLAGALAELPSKWKWAWDILRRVRSDIRFRAEQSDPQQYLSYAEAAPRGHGANRWWRRIKKAVGWSGRGMIRVDQSNRIVHFLAAIRQLMRENKLTGEALYQRAGDMAARWMYRVDAPVTSAAYNTPVGRAGKFSTAVAAVTAFMKGRLANFQVMLRAINEYRRDKDLSKLLYKLTIGAIVAAGFTAVGIGGAYLSGRKVGEGRGGVAGDFVENALGNTYGATEAIRLIRSKSAYGVQVFSSPPVAAAERVGQGLVGLRTAIEKSSGDKAFSASLKLLRGSASLAGIPTDQAFNLVRFMQSMRVGPGRLQPMKKKGARKPKARTYAEARRELFQKFKGRPARDWWAAARKLRAEWAEKG